MDFAANLALFLTEKTGSCLGTWKGKMTAQEQRQLFGKYLGRGKVTINGLEERVTHTIKIAYGNDYDDNHAFSWKDLK